MKKLLILISIILLIPSAAFTADNGWPRYGYPADETHASQHSADGADPITVTDLPSTCSDAEVHGGTAAGTGVECQADDDVPESGDFGNALGLKPDGSLGTDTVGADEMADENHGDCGWSGGVLTCTGASGDFDISGDTSSQSYQWNSMRAAGDLSDTTACKLYIQWETPTDNGTEVDRCGSNTITYDDASDWTSADRLTQCLSWMLDGDGSDDRVTVSADSSLELGDGTNSYDFSIEIVFKAPAAGAGEDILRLNSASGTDYFIGMFNSSIRAWFYDNSASAVAKQTTDTSYFTEDQIYHLVVTHDEAVGSGSTFNDGTKFYVNGTDITSSLAENTCITGNTCGTFTAIEANGGTMYIGANQASSSLFTGDLGDIEIYREALTPQQVKAHYYRSEACTCPR